MAQLATNGSTADGYCTTTSGPYTTQTTMLVGAPSSDSADSDSAEWHAFMFFDTSSIPTGSTISEVELDFRVTAVQGDPTGFRLKAYIGNNTIGSTLEKTDYKDTITNGTYFGQYTAGTGAKTQSVDDDEDVFDEINLSGYTNVEIDAYFLGQVTSSGLVSSMATQNHATSSYRPKLTVTYTAPASFVPQVMVF